MSLWVIRILFLAMSTVGGYAVSQVRPEFVNLPFSGVLGMAIGFGFGWLMIAIDEMRHAEKLIGRIIFLDGRPVVSELNALHIGQDVQEQLDNDHAAEQGNEDRCGRDNPRRGGCLRGLKPRDLKPLVEGDAEEALLRDILAAQVDLDDALAELDPFQDDPAIARPRVEASNGAAFLAGHSQGPVEDLRDLAVRLGFRLYWCVPGDYVERHRRDLESLFSLQEQGEFEDYVYLAEDLAQQTFVKAYKALAEGEPPENLNAWLYAIASHHCLNHLASREARTRRAATSSPTGWPTRRG